MAADVNMADSFERRDKAVGNYRRMMRFHFSAAEDALLGVQSQVSSQKDHGDEQKVFHGG